MLYIKLYIYTLSNFWCDLFLADILELRSDTGIISHWKDYQKLATYTYLSYQPSAPFTKADGSIVHVPMIPQTGMLKIGYVPQLKCLAAELMFEVSSRLLLDSPNLWLIQDKFIGYLNIKSWWLSIS